jgi:hypothetical protein
MNKISLFGILILFLLVINPVFAAEVKDFNFNVKLEREKINFNLDGKLIGNLTERDLFRIGQGGYFSPEYVCTISDQNCKISPEKIDIIIGPEETRQPDGSWKVTGNTTSVQINSPAFVYIPEGINGYLSIKFSILDVINKEKKLYRSFLELDKRERYTLNQFDLLQTTIPVEVKYFSIQVPDNFVLSDNSGFCYYTICGTPGICESCYPFKKLKDNSYTLENLSYSDKPYISGLTIPAYYLINLKLGFERSEEFTTKYALIALLTPFLTLFILILKTKKYLSLLMKGVPPFAVYIFLRTNYLKLDFIPLHVEDFYFVGLLLFLIVLVKTPNKVKNVKRGYLYLSGALKNFLFRIRSK